MRDVRVEFECSSSRRWLCRVIIIHPINHGVPMHFTRMRLQSLYAILGDGPYPRVRFFGENNRSVLLKLTVFHCPHVTSAQTNANFTTFSEPNQKQLLRTYHSAQRTRIKCTISSTRGPSYRDFKYKLNHCVYFVPS